MKFIWPMLISAGTIAGGGIAFFIPETLSKAPNTLTLYKKDSTGKLLVGQNPFVNNKGKYGGDIGTITLQNDSWKYRKIGNDGTFFNLSGEEKEGVVTNHGNLKNMVLDSEGTNSTSGLSGSATFYIGGMNCKELGWNYRNSTEETKSIFKIETSNNKDNYPIKNLVSEKGLAMWSCHENKKTLSN